MIKKLFLIGVLITFFFCSLSLFLPVLYFRYELKNYLSRYADEAVIQSDTEIITNIQAFFNNTKLDLTIFDLKVERTKQFQILIDYQQEACLNFMPKKTCLFPIRSTLTHSKNDNV